MPAFATSTRINRPKKIVKLTNMDRDSLMAQARQASLANWAEAQRKWQQEQYKNVPIIAEARVNQNNQAAAGASGTGSGGANTIPGLYGVASDGLIYTLDNFTNLPFNYIPFSSPPAVCNGGDGYIYAVVDDFGSIAFVSINIATGDILFYDNDISDFSQKGTSSLYREESGSFIYVDNGSKKSSITNIIRITIDGPDTASATLVNSIDSNDPGEFLLKQLYLVDGSVWATSLAIGETELTGPFDIDLGEFTQQPYQIESAIKNGELVSIDWITSCVQNNGIIYIYSVYDNSSSIGLFRFDIEAGYPTWIKDGEFPVGEGSEYILTLFNI